MATTTEGPVYATGDASWYVSDEFSCRIHGDGYIREEEKDSNSCPQDETMDWGSGQTTVYCARCRGTA